jgi:hypothetical protein
LRVLIKSKFKIQKGEIAVRRKKYLSRRAMLVVNLALALVLVSGLLVGPQLHAQSPTVRVEGTFLSAVEIIENNVPDNTNFFDVFTVPANRRLVITDVLIHASGFTACCMTILRNTLPATFSIFVGAAGFNHTFATGIEFTEGQTVAVSNPSGAPTKWHLRGYLTKAK